MTKKHKPEFSSGVKCFYDLINLTEKDFDKGKRFFVNTYNK